MPPAPDFSNDFCESELQPVVAAKPREPAVRLRRNWRRVFIATASISGEYSWSGNGWKVRNFPGFWAENHENLTERE